MSHKKCDKERCLEIILILICLALCCLLHSVGTCRMIVLNLFFLPVVLAAFFLGRYRAGVLALLCVMCVAVVMSLDLEHRRVPTRHPGSWPFLDDLGRGHGAQCPARRDTER